MTYVQFTEIKDTGKTKVWDVHNSNDGSYLGEIRWFGNWRKYVFFPAELTIWSSDCLADVAKFIDQRMDERKVARSNE